MTQTASTPTVGQLVVERPSRARIFERLGIDYCCGGKIALEVACNKAGLALNDVLRELETEAAEPAPQGTDWSKASLTELADHIEQTHHVYVKQELPRLNTITEKVARVHGERHPELLQVRELFIALKAEMDGHMYKEENILFPMIRQLDSASGPQSFHCGSVGNPIRVMVMEHEHAGDALAQMRRLTNGFAPPADACNTFRVMLNGLDQLEQDLHIHIHKENNILFPRAIETEQAANG